METTRIKVRIGQHEFEAEGPSEVVQSQFESFKQIIARESQAINQNEKKPVQQPENQNNGIQPEIEFDKFCRLDGRVVSLTIKPEAEATAATLIMLAQKNYRNNETVTASEIKDGLEQSGYRIDRLDRIMQPLADEGSIVKIGARKGTRYRFTNQGFSKAQLAAKQELGKIM